MTYDEAVSQALSGGRMTRPEWCWLYISADQRGKLSLFDEDGDRRGVYRPTKAEKHADDWQPYAA